MPDTLGNVIETRNMDTGAQTSSTTYWPYGEVRTQTGTNPSPFGFCGVWGYYTQAGQPTYVRARYYRPNLGRWQTVDPLWPTLQAFSYVNSLPTFFVDYFGLQGLNISPGAAWEFGWGASTGSPPSSFWPAMGREFERRSRPGKQVGGAIGGAVGAAIGLAKTPLPWNKPAGAKAGYIGGNLFVRCMLEPQLNCPKNARAEADNEIFDIAKDRFGRVDGNTTGNAVTHCTSACWATIRCGRTAAERFANGVYEDWTFGGNAFDRINNERGFDCGDSVSAGRTTPSVLDCYRCCIQNIVFGRQSWH
jgi:RHS repeat-associated protein